MTPNPRSHRAGSSPLRALRSSVASAAKTALFRTGSCAMLRRLAPSRRVGILRYHAICGEEGYDYASPSICISPDAFKAHVQYLAAHYQVLPLEEVVRRFAEHRSLPGNAIAITFDDGYADNLQAARVLYAHGLTATFFLTAGCLAGEAPFWVAEVRHQILHAPNGPLRLETPEGAVALMLDDSPSREIAIRRVTRLIKSHAIEVRDALLEQLRAAARMSFPTNCMLNWDQVAEMRRLGMSIAAHTLTHPNLPSAGLTHASEEIAGSKQRLERELGERVRLFSYPNGGAERYYTPAIQRLVAEAGFAAATSSRNGFADADSDLYALERIEVEERLEDLIFALEVERFAFAPGAA
jgi:peptidoglycan/xylan/chitin deacetylase (PgdA/CDA1 family)